MLNSRDAAIQQGLKRFNTGRPCKFGHFSDRFVSNRACVACIAEKTKSYLKGDTGAEILRRARANWRQANLDSRSEYDRIWRKDNPAKKRAQWAKRRASKKFATPLWADIEAIRKVYENCPSGMQVDHIIPLVHPLVCGLHVHNNLQYLTATENRIKGNRFDPSTFEN